MAAVKSVVAFRKFKTAESATLFPEPRNQMQDDCEVWLRLLGDGGYISYLHMTTEAALVLAIELLENIKHRHDVEEAVDVLRAMNSSSMVAAIYQSGCGELFEALHGKGADVINLNNADELDED